MKWINIIFAVIVWAVMFLLLHPKRIKELLPIGFFAVILLFIPQYINISLNLIRYNNISFPIMGMPFFQLVFVFAFGILLIHYMKENWLKKIPVLLLFTLINEIISYIIIRMGNLSLQNGYSLWIDALITFVVFSFGTWAAEGLFKDRIYHEIS